MDPELRLAMQMSMQADEPPRALVALPIVPSEPLEGEPGVLKLSVRSALLSFNRHIDVNVVLCSELSLVRTFYLLLVFFPFAVSSR